MEAMTEQTPPKTEQAMPETLQENIDMPYPSSIVKWEMEHGIYRVIKDGMMYIQCPDIDALSRKLQEEKQARRRQALQAKIAQQQAAAYLGEQERMNV